MESNREYHADNSHVGSSMLKVYRRSPARYKGLYIDGTIEPEETSPEMILGSVTHCLASGEPIEHEFLLARGCEDRRSKLWKSFEEEAKLKGLTAIPEGVLRDAKAMADALMADPIAKQYWESEGPTEEPIRWTRDGVKLKCKPDKLVINPIYDCTICVSLKTSAKADLPAFLWAIRDYDYDLSEAMYIDGIASIKSYMDSSPQCLMVVISKEPPHDVFVYHLENNKSVMPQGRIKFEDTVRALSHSLATNDWRSAGQKMIRSI